MLFRGCCSCCCSFLVVGHFAISDIQLAAALCIYLGLFVCGLSENPSSPNSKQGVEAAGSCWFMCMDYHFWLVIVARTEVLLLANRILEVNSCLVIICTLFVSFQDVKTLVWYKYGVMK